MMAKDSVKKRIEGEQGHVFTEFTYQLVQGYDFLLAVQNLHCKLQMGGSDQWGNIVTGTELIRRKLGRGLSHFLPADQKADGGKLVKRKKEIFDLAKDLLYQFYQFC